MNYMFEIHPVGFHFLDKIHVQNNVSNKLKKIFRTVELDLW